MCPRHTRTTTMASICQTSGGITRDPKKDRKPTLTGLFLSRKMGELSTLNNKGNGVPRASSHTQPKMAILTNLPFVRKMALISPSNAP